MLEETPKPFPAYTGSEPYYFVCYAHDDATQVYAELARLRTAGANIWYDEGITPGSEWSESLARAIRNAATLLFFVTPRSIQSKHCRDEVGYAKENDTPILCIHLEKTELTEGLKLSLGASQAIMKHELSGLVYERKLQQMLSGQDTSLPEPHNPRPQKARLRLNLVALGVMIACIIGVAAWYNGQLWSRADGTHPPIDPKSIAVLPFVNRSADPDSRYFVDGVHDDVLTQLARLKDLKVISQASVAEYRRTEKSKRDIGRELGVATLLEGAIQRAGDRVRITIQLVDATTEVHLWADTFDRALSPENVFEIQTEIANATAKALAATLVTTGGVNNPMDRAPTFNQQAYDLYLRSRAIPFDSDIENLWRAIDLAKQAVELDPDFALAMGQIAEIYINIYWFTTQNPEHRDASRTWLERALAISPEDPRLQLILGILLYEGYLDYEAAKVALNKAQLGLPGNSTVYLNQGAVLRRSGSISEAIEAFNKAQLLDPRDVFVAAHHIFSYLAIGDVAGARRQGARVRALPQATSVHIGFTHLVDIYMLGDTTTMANYLVESNNADLGSEDHLKVMVPLLERRYDDARKALESLPDPIVEQFNLWTHSYVRARLLYSQQRFDEARDEALLAVRELDQIIDSMPGNARPVVARALMHAMLGNDDQAKADIKRTAELYPIEMDPIDGPNYYADGLRAVAVFADTADLVRQLEHFASLPTKIYYLDYLLLDPVFDRHRDHPDIKVLQKDFSLRSLRQ